MPLIAGTVAFAIVKSPADPFTGLLVGAICAALARGGSIGPSLVARALFAGALALSR